MKSDQMQLNERFNFSMLLSILEIAGIHIVFVNVVKKVLTPPSLSIHPIVLIVQATQCQVISYQPDLELGFKYLYVTCNLCKLLKIKGQVRAVLLRIINNWSHSFNLTHISQASVLITGVQRQSLICSGPVNIYLFKMEQLQQERQRLMYCVLVAGQLHNRIYVSQ